MTVRRGLILSASYGSGHNRVAGALVQAFAQAGVETRLVDHFRELVHPQFERFTRRLYYGMLRATPAMWGLAYWVGDQIPVSSPVLLGLTRLGMPKLARLLRAERPDFVVSVHPTPAAGLSELRGRGVEVPSHTTVFTDWVAHTQWIYPRVDRYCVPAEETARDLIARGIPRERVQVTGIPVGAGFARPVEAVASVRLRLGLAPRLPLLLCMDGAGGGFGRLEEAVETLVAMGAACQIVVVAGRGPGQERIKTRLERRQARVKVLGFVDNVRELMGAADFLVSKAGGVTLAEALTAELPMVCFGSLAGQERRNERFAAMAGVGLLARSSGELEQVLGAALHDPVLVQKIRERIRAYRRPRATEHVVDMVLGVGSASAERAS